MKQTKLTWAEILLIALIMLSVMSSCITPKGAGRMNKPYKPTYASKAFSSARLCGR